MLIIFKKDTSSPPPSLPDLNIADSSSGADVPVGGLNGWDNDFIQTQALCFAPLQFEAEETGLTGESSQYWTRRLSKFSINTRFSAAAANAVVRIVYYDGNGVKALSKTYTINATAITDGARYIGENLVVDTFGANKMAINVVSVSSGTVDVRMAGI